MATPHLRIARPVIDLARSTEMYCRGLGLTVLGSFRDHDGFDGAMLGDPDSRYHFEFTHCPSRAVRPTPTVEDLVVLYIPEESRWHASCASMVAAGFRQVASFNPYWDVRGRTYEDADGYRTVLERAEWRSTSRRLV
jgi:catechol 2,3-dioxygenase-like lactoylglutathione lyase family enzyme